MATTTAAAGARDEGTYTAVRAVAIALLAGAVLQASGVSAGNGIVIDWRSVKSGQPLLEDADAFDTAYLFVMAAGAEEALASLGENAAPEAPPVPVVAPRVHEYAEANNGGRRRSFDAGPFRVFVEPHEDDAAQATFASALAAAAHTMMAEVIS